MDEDACLNVCEFTNCWTNELASIQVFRAGNVDLTGARKRAFPPNPLSSLYLKSENERDLYKMNKKKKRIT